MARTPIVDSPNFLLATRDSGYRSTAYAVAEFVDNSLQAGATLVAIDVLTNPENPYPIELLIVDDGAGMDKRTLASALSFGGSSRFGDRSSLGRYGMGLPNGALSCARRVEVITWRGNRVLTSRLDLDELVGSRRRSLPPVEEIPRPPFLPGTRHGTAVHLCHCDRLEHRRASTVSRKLHEELGRIYRRVIDRGVELRVNAEAVAPIDPLLLKRNGSRAVARRFGEVLRYQLDSADGNGAVEVLFTELPVDRWHDLSTDEKRQLGITNAPPVSIMRADREIDRGWFFMGGKRRENYDDWWRCEINFDPVLDELFGITHAKQGICPRPELLAVLEGDLESIARALNSRVRQRFELAKATKPLGDAERQAARAESSLPSLPRRREALPESLRQLLAKHDVSRDVSASPYQIVVGELATTAAFEVVRRRDQLVLVFNSRHPLYRDLYGPLAMSDSEKDHDVAKRVALAVLAAARAEASATHRSHLDEVRRFRQAWADVLATFYTA
jgi:Histidine kinase-, DNA gyrase B-, and HSP90-like ATPase